MSKTNPATISREHDTRENNAQPQAWKPAPTGGILGLENNPDWSFKWGNTDVQGDSRIVDSTFARRLQEGWAVVNPSDHEEFNKPELKIFVKGEQVRRNGQILLKMPKAMAKSRNDYYMAEDRRKRSVSMSDLLNAPAGFTTSTEGTTRQTYVGANVKNI